MKVVVIGAGAIGGVCAALIQKAGIDVQVVVRRKEHAQSIREKGIRISGIKGDYTAKVNVVHDISDMKTDRELILLGVKALALKSVSEALAPMINQNAMVVSLQNGFCEEMLADVLGRDRVIGCVTGWGATMQDDCHLEMTSPGDFIIGNIDNHPDPRLVNVQMILNHVLKTHISNNIIGSLYSKLIINSCITSVGAVCGLYLGQMLAIKKARLIFLHIMEEAMAVAVAMDIKVETFANKLNYYDFLKSSGKLATIKQHIFLRILGFKYRHVKSSSLQSLERGRRTEIDYLTGYITSNGKRIKVPTPVNDQVFAMVRGIENGQQQIQSKNLDLIEL